MGKESALQIETEEVNFTPEMATSLVKKGRVPIMEDVERGVGYNAQMGIMFHIPPEGTQHGDTYERRVGGLYEFRGPGGEFRGRAKTEWLPIHKARAVRAAVEATLRSEGKDTSDWVGHNVKRAVRYIRELARELFVSE